MIAALEGASGTALPAGMDAIPMRFTFKAFRPVWPGKGNLLARARVVNDSNLFVFAEVQVEDPDGRHVGLGSLHSTIQPVEPAPPPPPETMKRIEEPVYETPDPYLRSFPSSPFVDLQEREDGVTTSARSPTADLSAGWSIPTGCNSTTSRQGTPPVHARERVVLRLGADVSCQAIGTLADMSGWLCAITLQRPGMSVVLLDSDTRFLHSVRPDGRRLRSEMTVSESPRICSSSTRRSTTPTAASSRWTSRPSASTAARRIRRQRKESRRVLATLLFTDIVDSTGHAQRLGDAAWRTLLERAQPGGASRGLALQRHRGRHHRRRLLRPLRLAGARHRGGARRSPGDDGSRPRHPHRHPHRRVRAGRHRLTGMAVHIASRIQAAAARRARFS